MSYFIKIDPKFLKSGYLEHHARLLTYIANWHEWKIKGGKGSGGVYLSIKKIAIDLNRSVATVYRWIGELSTIAIDRVAETAKFTGNFFKRVFSYSLSPDLPSQVEYDRETKSYQAVEPCQNSHGEKINSHDETKNSHDENHSICINQSSKDKKNQLTKVGDVVDFSSLSNTEPIKSESLIDDPLQLISEEPIETTSSEVKQAESLVVSKPLEKGNVPAACDKKKPIKTQSKDNITSTDRTDYKVKLAAIGVAVQNVEWVIRQIPAQEREEVVTSAIAWVSEQKWVEQPAAAFVGAVRTRKQSAAVVNQELRQIIDDNKSIAQQFTEWFDAMKTRRLVEQSMGHDEHYATVVVTELAIELLRQLQHDKEFAELERMTQSDRDERLAEMEQVELAGEVTLPSYGQSIPWREARELLLCLTQNIDRDMSA